MSEHSSPKSELKIAIVGDIHDQWDELGDRRALELLAVDCVLFVGDFGNEAVDLVAQIAALPLPKAAIFGNHDAWYTASDWGRKKAPYDHALEDRVQLQLDLLGDHHVGYGCLDFPSLNLSIIGSRPFSWGGEKWKNKRFLSERFGVNSFEESLALMMRHVQSAQCDNLIFLGHNGPTGLGVEPEDMCGRDWNPLGGDFGDPDFAQAIAATKKLGKNIAFVTFGHMHYTLRHRKDRLRTRVKCQDQTLYVNAAQVPRLKQYPNGDRHHAFSVVTLSEGRPKKSELVWVNPNQGTQERQTLWDCHQLELASS
ncbi:TIGR04168 family protein [[Limnothrix rosea] IAM M-220]|uniref:TIGR04168 family protein n=1 Tax=[Limnothrix rosea] IAM M-220 TaxID=454133 RepID=UPI00095F4854|nr:TIGR04168 family protein [[Limnothrix rosea] IAM M-220]OKH20030.1 TIGR04168 family protein [[Limnothrix rosea] IAM M-220]